MRSQHVCVSWKYASLLLLLQADLGRRTISEAEGSDWRDREEEVRLGAGSVRAEPVRNAGGMWGLCGVPRPPGAAEGASRPALVRDRVGRDRGALARPLDTLKRPRVVAGSGWGVVRSRR